MIPDVRGRPFEFALPPRRVVSLVPSITETLFDLGAGESVAGITDFCIFPAAELARLPRLGGTKNPKIDEIESIQPDLVYMNLEENLRRHADAIERFAPVFVTEPKSVNDAVEVVRTLGAIHGRESLADRWADEVAVERRLLASREVFTFACAIWKNPWMWCGGDTYVSDLVTVAGGENIFAGENRYPAHTIDEVLALRPDIIFLPDEPFLFTLSDVESLKSSGANRVVGPFPGHLFTWHGTRTLLGLRFLRDF